MKIQHHSIFKNLNSNNIDWSFIRNDFEEEKYFMPRTKEEYINLVKNDYSNEIILNEISSFLDKLNINHIFSLGSGRAFLEYKLKIRNFKVIVSDNDKSINKLKQFNLFDKAYNLSIENAKTKLKNFQGLVLLSRIDTELTDSQLMNLFSDLSSLGVKYVFFIPAQLLTLKSFFTELLIRIKSILYRKKLVKCGYSRSNKLLKKLWKKFYNVKSINKKYYLLELL
tara:strand:+ start:5734 stop:6408 length:675 start_codon:yes stop_codon:yes gene_type:complete